jgi:hypothetical protein
MKKELLLEIMFVE